MSKALTGFGFLSALVSYDPNSYLETNGSGNLRMQIPAGTNNVVFPVGNGSFTPIVVTNSSPSSDYFDVRVENGVSPSGAGTTTDFVNKTWLFQEVNAFADRLSFQFFWNAGDEQSNFDRSMCWGAHHNGSNWDVGPTLFAASFINIFGVAQYEVQRANLATFGALTVASDGLLPVELTAFSAQATDKGHLLKWNTASELNNSHFEIEYSSDGSHFTTIGEVKGYGTTQAENSYSWLHQTETEFSIHYYRLKQVDFDGQYTYSDIVVLEHTISDRAVYHIYPSLASDQLHIRIPSESRRINQMSIFSIDGHQVWQYPLAAGDQIDVPISHWANGMYVVYGPGLEGVLQPLGRFVKQ